MSANSLAMKRARIKECLWRSAVNLGTAIPAQTPAVSDRIGPLQQRAIWSCRIKPPRHSPWHPGISELSLDLASSPAIFTCVDLIMLIVYSSSLFEAAQNSGF